MGRIRDFLTGTSPVIEASLAPESFAANDVVDWDALGGPQFVGAADGTALTVAPRISRSLAIGCPAVKRARDLIAGGIGGLPVDVTGPRKIAGWSSLLDQPEKSVPRSVTMTRTVEDMFFEGVAWWKIEEFGWHTYPTSAKRLDPRSVSITDGKVYVDGKHVRDEDLIRFDSPNDALLISGARAIRSALLLDSAAANMADGVPPFTYFVPVEGADPGTDEDIATLLDNWQIMRRLRATGYVPAALDLKSGGWNPKDLQLAEARQHAVLEIARVVGVDPEELGVSTTSRTYFNAFDRKQAFLNFTLGPYMHALEDRLSMGDVTPRGYSVKFNMSSFLRSDDLTRMQTYEVGKRVGAYTTPEVRDLEDRPALAPADIAAIEPVSEPAREPVAA